MAASMASSWKTANADGKPAERVDGEFRFLLETVVCDLSWSLMQVATLTTLVNACARRDEPWTLFMWRHLLLDESASMKLALRYWAELGVSQAARGVARLLRRLCGPQASAGAVDGEVARQPLMGVAQRSLRPPPRSRGCRGARRRRWPASPRSPRVSSGRPTPRIFARSAPSSLKRRPARQDASIRAEASTCPPFRSAAAPTARA